MRPTAILPLATLLMAAPVAAALPQGPSRSALVTSAVLMCFARAAASSEAASPRSVTIEHLDAEGGVVYGATYEVSRAQPRPATTAESVSCRFTSRGTTPSLGSTPHVDEAGARAHAANRTK